MLHLSATNHRELRRTRIADLSRQLDAVFLSIGRYHHTPRIMNKPKYFPANCFDRTLFDSWLFDSDDFAHYSNAVRHLRFRIDPDEIDFALLSKSIKEGALVLKSLHLPIDSQYSATPFAHAFRQICQEKAINVVYEEQDFRWRDSFISEEFCRRQREVRLDSATYD